jgi:predicted  nucleic acid-binding Zn-ribbon protein
LPMDIDALKAERDKLKKTLRELETEQRRVESELKSLRQRELKTKRQIEALSTLVELDEIGADREAEEAQE